VLTQTGNYDNWKVLYPLVTLIPEHDKRWDVPAMCLVSPRLIIEVGVCGRR